MRSNTPSSSARGARIATATPKAGLSAIAPKGTAISEWIGAAPAALAPVPSEAALVAQSGPGRREEFALGRWCARNALAQLGQPKRPILRTIDRAPAWPEGFVGSITHTQDYVAAIAAPARRFTAIGIDAERCCSVTRDLWPDLFTDAERARLVTLGDQAGELATIMFSAKEAYFKAFHPHLRQWLDFRQMEIDAGDGSWSASPASGAGAQAWPAATGRFAVGDDLVVTCICVPA